MPKPFSIANSAILNSGATYVLRSATFNFSIND
nr:MAG TPA: hypothetical protein [Caudoviricetes sp.]